MIIPGLFLVHDETTDPMNFTQRFSSCTKSCITELCFRSRSTNLRLEVGLLRSSQYVSGGDVEVKQDLSK